MIPLNLICKRPSSDKVDFDHTPRGGGGGGGSAGKNICYHVAACIIPFIGAWLNFI